MLGLLGLVFAAGFVAQGAVSPLVDVSAITVSVPTTICELDVNLLQGDLHRLSWGPNNASIHVQTIEERGRRLRDYLIDVYNGEVSLAFGQPEWAAAYWKMKSDLAAPGLPSLRLELTRIDRRTTHTPAIAAANPGGAYAPEPRDAVEAFESEVSLRLLGEPIGSWVNDAPIAGETYGWGPAGSAALVFVDRDGRLLFIDQAKRKRIVAGIKGATMPAWSVDGTRVAWVQKSGRRKYTLAWAAVTRG